MRVLVIGCGSIGARRARLLARMPAVDELWLYDADFARASVVAAAASVTRPLTLSPGGVDAPATMAFSDPGAMFAMLPHAGGQPVVAFICTPPESHVDIALDLLHAGLRGLFIEKPLALTPEGLDELERAAEGRTVMVACNMRFAYGDVPRRPDWLVAAQSKPLAAWRPGAEAYRRNGLMLEAGVHELDLAYWLAGPGKVQDAEWQGPDTCTVKLEHESGAHSNVYVSWADNAPTVRWLRTSAMEWAMAPDTSDAMYAAEMRHFLACVESGERPTNTLADARHVLGWALAANAMREVV